MKFPIVEYDVKILINKGFTIIYENGIYYITKLPTKYILLKELSNGSNHFYYFIKKCEKNDLIHYHDNGVGEIYYFTKKSDRIDRHKEIKSNKNKYLLVK